MNGEQHLREQHLEGNPKLVDELLNGVAAETEDVTVGKRALEVGADWADPQPLGPELLPVHPFAAEFLPESCRPWVEDVAERMQVPIDMPAAAAVIALAGAVNRRAIIFPKRKDTGWTVVPNLWGGIVSPPGHLKTPVIETITQPLVKTEALWQQEYECEIAAYREKELQQKLKHQAWGEQFKQAYKKNQELPSFTPDDTARAPVAKRLLITDATVEKLHEMLNENPAGILCICDELQGKLAEFTKPGREGEREFYLKAWDGKQPHAIDRIGRGSICVPAVCISFFGAIQPARLRAFLRDPLAGGASDDGFLQRLQVFVWPDVKKDFTLIDRPPNAGAEIAFAGVLDALLALSADYPTRLRLSEGAQPYFDSWLIELEKEVRSDSGMHPALVNHLAKYRSLLPSLAGLFELADRAASRVDLDGELSISLEHSVQAAEFCEYLEGHARRIYGCIMSKTMHSARELARRITSGDLKDTFTTREVYRHGWSGLTSADETSEALDLLADLNWVRPISPLGQRPIIGRPTELWQVNPKVQTKGKHHG